jgi:hypothetical protein
MEHFSKIVDYNSYWIQKNPKKEIIDVVGMKIPTILKCLVLD